MGYKAEQMALGRKHLDQRLTALREADIAARPHRGWIRAIRDALGITSTQLARRLSVSQPRIVKLEKAEVNGSISLASLKAAAEALNCTLVYALVPNESLDDMLKHRAEKIAENQIKWTNHTMKLENQALSKNDLDVQRKRLVEKLIEGNLHRLWDEEK